MQQAHNHIGSVCEYLQPPARKLTEREVSDVANELANKIRSTVLLLTCSDGGDMLELVHNDLMAILHGLTLDAATLCKVLDNKGSEL